MGIGGGAKISYFGQIFIPGLSYTALHAAVASFKNEYVKILLENGASDVNIRDNYGYTALHLATTFRYHDIVKTLLDYGADTGIKDNDGYTTMKIAFNYDDDYMFNLMYEKDTEKAINETVNYFSLVKDICKSEL